MKGQIVELVNRVHQGEQNVTQMHDAMQQTWQALFESVAYLLLTRQDGRPHEINETLTQHLYALATLAYPDPEARHNIVQQVLAKARAARQESNPK
jgi:hypothetical protein